MANMFSGKAEKKIPKNLEECYKTEEIALNLWEWSKRLETLGQFLLVVIIIAGMIFAVASSITVTEAVVGKYDSYTTTETSFDIMTFIMSLITTAIYAFIEYCVYHILALLVSSLAKIVQNTKITANVALYNVAKGEGVLFEEMVDTQTAPDKKATQPPTKGVSHKVDAIGCWMCDECGTKNDSTALYCKECGEYK